MNTEIDRLTHRVEQLEELLRRMVEHTPLDTLSYEQVRELGREALSEETRSDG